MPSYSSALTPMIDNLGIVLGGGRGDNLLGAAIDDGLGGLLGEEDNAEPKAVDGAGRARDEVLAAVVLVGVDAHGDDLGVVLGRG